MLDILIVGAGCSGLAAATFLALGGHHVRVLERRSSIDSGGGALVFQPAAVRVLQHHGLSEALDAIGDRLEADNLVDGQTFKVLRSRLVMGSAYGVYRKQLVQLFRRSAEAAGVVIECSRSVNAVEDEPGRRPAVILANKDRIEADLVICADGVRSRTRPQVLADLVEINPYFSVLETCTYQMKVPLSKLGGMEEGRRLLNNVWTSYIGNNQSIAIYTARKSGHLFVGCSVKDDKFKPGRLYEDDVDLDWVKEHFRAWPAAFRLALDLAENVQRWQFTEVPDLPRWSSKAGRIILLGDCAHAMDPSAGQGCSMGVEAAGALAHLLSERFLSSPRQVPEMVPAWQAATMARANDAKAFSANLTTGLRYYRNTDGARPPKDPRAKVWRTEEYFSWLYGHDAIAAAEQALYGISSAPVQANL